jgi:hypothetical protein
MAKSIAMLLTATLIVFARADGSGSGSADTPQVKVSTRKKDDTVDVKTEKGRTILEIHSPAGISSGVIERRDEKWPEKMVVRLHLNGLESFRASNGKVVLDAAVSNTLEIRQWKDGKEGDKLDAKSPLWTDIQPTDGQGKPAKQLPLKDGYFEITLPKALLEGNPKSITLNWVDFFR